jgi:hypothetical protein
VRNIRKKDERERVLENFETCLSREECALQFSERIHKQKKRSESSRGTHPLLPRSPSRTAPSALTKIFAGLMSTTTPEVA